MDRFCAQNMDSIPSPPVLTLDPNDENIILEIPKDVDPTEESAEPTSKKEKVKEASVWLWRVQGMPLVCFSGG